MWLNPLRSTFALQNQTVFNLSFKMMSIQFPAMYVTGCDHMSCSELWSNLCQSCLKSICTFWKCPLLDEKMLRAAVEAKTRILATLLLGSNCVFLGFSGSPSLSLQLPFLLKVNSRRPLQNTKKRSGEGKKENVL